ncbi:transcription regulator gal80 [Aspergillus nanangensis]|uniref:Transcription regulator gal80 n=1 Tax=Aspergillus nanangensis TaxID=2582783 RepID=A0AAD4GTB4_ASPNN|nr:transcription regulator gal80 [Aspergillus nanangensis]
MAVIRVGLIGLSGASSDDYEGTSWAAGAHLPFLTASPSFQIVALLNSSAESAQAAIRKYDLPAETKAYGDPTELALDPDVDLVLCCVRVDRHLLTVRPSLVAGKAVYVEWPLDRNLDVAKEMASLAIKHHAKTVVGLQSSFNPVIRKMRSLVQGNAIGRVLSSSFIGAAGNQLQAESKNVRYFLDRSVGGSMMSIHAGHTLETVISVLGPFQTFDSSLTISRPELDIVNLSTGEVLESGVRNTVPDQILMFGTSERSSAAVTVKIHAGEEFPGQPRLDWRIQGTRGWLRLTSPALFINVGGPEVKVELFRTDTGQVEEIEPDKDEWETLPIPAQNIARLLEAYRQNEWYPTFDWAVQRHDILDGMWRKFDLENAK